ncbi:hypothetical protein MFRU_003g00040 [Monilinia fructicola]|nr:hypothetical protein MFRU_003g00040 [Monilinia fructicola]
METVVQPGISEQELYLLNRRDEEEKDRLDQQSNAIRIVRHGHVLDPKIPKQNISRVADIATGTGIWLREMMGELANEGYSSPVETVGFDISAEQFPKSSAPGNKFVVWDMTTSFPEEYHNSFDVVHIRLVILAIKAEQIKDVVKNLVELLKPGGYLQWTDISHMNGLDPIHRVDDDDMSFKSQAETVFGFLAEKGYSFDPIGDAETCLRGLPVEEAYVIDSTNESYHRPEIRGMVTEWQARTTAIVIEMMLSHNGQSKEQAKMAAEMHRKKAVEAGRRGAIFKTMIATLVARKKSEL